MIIIMNIACILFGILLRELIDYIAKLIRKHKQKINLIKEGQALDKYVKQNASDYSKIDSRYEEI